MTSTMPMHSCAIKKLPNELQMEAAAAAIEENPTNYVDPGRLTPIVSEIRGLMGAELATEPPLPPPRLALLIGKRWAATGVRLKVFFMEKISSALLKRIMGALNRWADHGNIRFDLVGTARDADIRITFKQSGYWSYLGPDCRLVPTNQPTMCFQGFTDATPDSEITRVVIHEGGHALGLVHEHNTRGIVDRIDRELAIEEFMRTQGWTREDVIYQVLTAYEDIQLLRSPPDIMSIMCYWLSAKIMKDRIEVTGGHDLSPTDIATIAQCYPPLVAPPPPPPPPPPVGTTWSFTASGTGDKPVIAWK